MYTDEDLDYAVKKEVFTSEAIAKFRNLIASSKNSPAVDEENFKLIGGFNDVFIVIASSLLLFSTLGILIGINKSLALLVFTALSWILAEFFVLKRKMALPAIVLLLTFIGGFFALTITLLLPINSVSIMIAAALSATAAYCHWLRFKVPITIAVGTIAGLALLIMLILSLLPSAKSFMLMMLFISGFLAFSFAMYWDASDINRTTSRSDVAFWLHLVSAPLIIHPIFSVLGILGGNDSLINMIVVIALYLLMTAISIAIDRRAFMLSSLVYVLYAITALFQTYGGIGHSVAITGVIMGASLLLLSAYWHRARAFLVVKLPRFIQQKIPPIKAS